MREEAARPQVTVTDPVGPSLVVEPPHGQASHVRRPRRSLLALTLILVVLAGVLAGHRSERSGWLVDPAQVNDGGRLAVTLVNHGGPVRVTDVRLRDEALFAIAPAALADEVVAAEQRGVPTAHDTARVLGRGAHTFLLDVRPRCAVTAGSPTGPAVLLEVEQAGSRRTVASVLPRDVHDRLHCTPLALHAGLSPAPPVTGQVQLLLTARSGSADRPRLLRELRWPGYHLDGADGVVAEAVRGADVDESVFFDVVLTTDCSVPAVGGLTASFDGAELGVPVSTEAAARVRALRGRCR